MYKFIKNDQADTLNYIRTIKWIIAIILIFIISFLIRSWEPFYEDARYLAYLRSFINDWDLNIINQVPSLESWLVTKNLFHYDFHPNVQISFLLPLFAIEYVANFLASSSIELNYLLTSFITHIFCIYFGIYYMKKIATLYSIDFTVFTYVLFTISSSLLYFSCLIYNVIEIFAFPFLSYALYNFFKLRFKQNSFNLVALGLSLSILYCTKVTYSIFCLYLYLLFLHKAWQERSVYTALKLLLPGLIFFIAYYSNMLLSHGGLVSIAHAFRFLLDFSFHNLWTTVLYGFGGLKGLFSSNLAFIPGVVGLILFFLDTYKKNILNIFDIACLVLWLLFSFTQTIFLIGNVVEDHLVGRIFLTSLPLLLLGYTYLFHLLKSRLKQVYFWIWVIISVGWNCYLTFIYILNLNVSHYSYNTPSAFSNSVLSEGWRVLQRSFVDNAIILSENISFLFFYVLLVLIIIYFVHKLKLSKFSNIVVMAAIVYVIITCINYYYAPRNIKILQQENFYQDKVIGNGDELYAFDLQLDMLNTVYINGDDQQKKMVLKRVKQFYQTISKQVIKSTPAFDRELKLQSLDATIYIQKEINKDNR